MPHKRAKNTTRQLEREKRGSDLPPSGGTSVAQEILPKSLTRVLQAETVRKNYKAKRERIDNGDGDGERSAKRRRKDIGEGAKKLEIKHGESLSHFNRRVEDDMRVPVAEAMQASRNHAKRTKKSEAKVSAVTTGKTVIPDSATPKSDTPASKPGPARKTEFDTKPSTKRLNDIVQAPPNFTKLPRGAAKAKANSKVGMTAGKSDGIVSMAQKHMMGEERERAIRRYRELRESRAQVG